MTYIRKYKKDEMKEYVKNNTLEEGHKPEYFVFPCINDVLEGLMQWMTRQIEGFMKGASLNSRKKMINNSRSTFEIIFGALEFTLDEMNKPM